jgi:uncharacterized protein (TIGR02285 family)
VAICALFLRSIVYRKQLQSDISQVVKSQIHTDPPVILAYHERPPYYVTNEENLLTGLVGGPARTAFHRSGLQFIIQRMPPRRQLNSIQNNTERICAVGWFKTPEREHYALFTSPLYQDKPTSLLTRFDIELPSLNPTLHEVFAASHLSLLMKNSYSYGESIDNTLQHTPPSIVITTSGNTSQMLEMIAAANADYALMATEEAEEAIATSNSPGVFRLVKLRDMPQGNKRYIMCSRQVTPEEIARLNSVIPQLTTPDRTALRKQ